MLTVTQCPYTGPYGLPESGLPSKGKTPVALKRAMGRLQLLPWPDEPGEAYDEHFNEPLARALAAWDPGKTGYGPGRWEKIRATRVPAGLPHAGDHALDSVALQLIREDWQAHHMPPPFPALVYPHDKDWPSFSGGFIHQTGGIAGNYALDFMAGPGTPVLASEAGTVSRTAGHDPDSGLHGAGDVFGWSVYLRCKGGFFYDTHYGKLNVQKGDTVRPGDILGWVGDWPRDRPRSHLHRGYTSFSGSATTSRNKIRAVAAAPRVDGRNPL